MNNKHSAVVAAAAAGKESQHWASYLAVQLSLQQGKITEDCSRHHIFAQIVCCPDCFSFIDGSNTELC